MNSPYIDVRFPKISAETPIARTHSNSPARTLKKEPTSSKNYSPRIILRQKHQKSLIDENLSSKFFFEDTSQSKTVYLSPKTEKVNFDSNSILRREIQRANEKLISNEIFLCNVNENDENFKKLKAEFQVYMEYFQQIANCFGYKYPELYKTIHKAISCISKIFQRLFFKFSAELEIEKPKIEKAEGPKKFFTENFVQTIEPTISICSEYDLENLKTLNEKLKSINMSKVTRRLGDLHKSLIEMNITVPKTPESPNLDSENFLKLLIKLHRPDKIIDTSEKNLQTDEIPKEKNVFQFNTNEKLQVEFYLLQKKYEESQNVIEKIQRNQNPAVLENDLNKILKDQELEIMNLKSKLRNLEQVTQISSLNVSRNNEIRKKSGNSEEKKEIKSTNKVSSEVDEQKKKLQEQISLMKNNLNVFEAKLIEIEDAWLKKTGKEFQYNSKSTEIKHEPKKVENKQVSSVTKSNLDFESPKRKQNLPQRKIIQNSEPEKFKPNPLPKKEHLSQSLIPQLEKFDKIPTVLTVPPKKLENSNKSSEIVQVVDSDPIQLDLPASNLLQMPKYLPSESSELPSNHDESVLNYEDTKESYPISDFFDAPTSFSDEIEEKIFKALSKEQWALFIEYKLHIQNLIHEKKLKNLVSNSKACGEIYVSNEYRQVKKQKHSKNLKSAEIMKEKSEVDLEKVNDELESVCENPEVSVILQKTFEKGQVMTIPIAAKIELLKTLKKHIFQKCGADCEHLRRAMMIGFKYRGKLYPIKKIKII